MCIRDSSLFPSLHLATVPGIQYSGRSQQSIRTRRESKIIQTWLLNLLYLTLLKQTILANNTQLAYLYDSNSSTCTIVFKRRLVKWAEVSNELRIRPHIPPWGYTLIYGNRIQTYDMILWTPTPNDVTEQSTCVRVCTVHARARALCMSTVPYTYAGQTLRWSFGT